MHGVSTMAAAVTCGLAACAHRRIAVLNFEHVQPTARAGGEGSNRLHLSNVSRLKTAEMAQSHALAQRAPVKHALRKPLGATESSLCYLLDVSNETCN